MSADRVNIIDLINQARESGARQSKACVLWQIWLQLTEKQLHIIIIDYVK